MSAYRTNARPAARVAPIAPAWSRLRAWLRGTFTKLHRCALGQCSTCRRDGRAPWWQREPMFSPLPPIPPRCRCRDTIRMRGWVIAPQTEPMRLLQAAANAIAAVLDRDGGA